MIESVSVPVSLIDGQPIGYSPAHRMVRGLLGCVAASLTSEDEILMHPPDEVTPHVETDRATSDRLGAAG